MRRASTTCISSASAQLQSPVSTLHLSFMLDISNKTEPMIKNTTHSSVHRLQLNGMANIDTILSPKTPSNQILTSSTANAPNTKIQHLTRAMCWTSVHNLSTSSAAYLSSTLHAVLAPPYSAQIRCSSHKRCQCNLSNAWNHPYNLKPA